MLFVFRLTRRVETLRHIAAVQGRYLPEYTSNRKFDSHSRETAEHLRNTNYPDD